MRFDSEKLIYQKISRQLLKRSERFLWLFTIIGESISITVLGPRVYWPPEQSNSIIRSAAVEKTEKKVFFLKLPLPLNLRPPRVPFDSGRTGPARSHRTSTLVQNSPPELITELVALYCLPLTALFLFRGFKIKTKNNKSIINWPNGMWTADTVKPRTNCTTFSKGI